MACHGVLDEFRCQSPTDSWLRCQSPTDVGDLGTGHKVHSRNLTVDTNNCYFLRELYFFQTIILGIQPLVFRGSYVFYGDMAEGLLSGFRRQFLVRWMRNPSRKPVDMVRFSHCLQGFI